MEQFLDRQNAHLTNDNDNMAPTWKQKTDWISYFLKVKLYEVEKDPIWKSLADHLNNRAAAAARDHLKQLVQHARTMTSHYSLAVALRGDRQLLQPKEMDMTEEEFDLKFLEYCAAIWNEFNTLAENKKRETIKTSKKAGEMLRNLVVNQKMNNRWG